MAEQLQQTCPGCGATQTYDSKQDAMKCSHCGTEIEIPKFEEEIPKAVDSDLVVPASLTEAELVDITHAYMVGGKHTPDDMLEAAQIVERSIYFVPAHYYFGKYKAKWTASFGYDRQEAYTAYRTNTKGEKEPYTAYRTVTDWQPASGSDSGEFGVQVYAGEGTDSRVVQLVENANTRKMQDFSKKYLSGYELHDFKIASGQAHSNRGASLIDQAVGRGVRSHAQGDHSKNWHWTSNLQTKAKTLVVPVAKTVFEYEGKSYTLWVDATGSKQVLGDALPEDTQRKKALSNSFIPLWTTAGVSVLLMAFFQLDPIIGLVTPVAPLVLGLMRRKAIQSFSKTRRENSLLQKRASDSANNELSEDQLERLAASYATIKVPKLAETRNDKVLIPATSGALALVLLLGVLIPNIVHASNSYSPSETTDESDYVVEDPTSWIPDGYQPLPNDNTLAYKNISDSSVCTSEATDGCYVVSVALNTDCFYGVTVVIDELDAAGTTIGSIEGVKIVGIDEAYFASGGNVAVQINASGKADSAQIGSITCR